MRCLVLILGLLFTVSTASAKPKIAVTPFKGDKNNKVADAIAEALAEQAKVTEPKATGKAIRSLDLGKELDNDDAKQLRKELEVDAVVQGRLDKDGKKRKLKISVFVRGKEPARFTVQFKTTSVKFRDDMRDVIMKKVELADDDDGKKKKKKKKNDDDDDDKKKKKKKKRIADGGDDDGDTEVRKKRKEDRDADDETPAGPRKLAARLDVGAFGGVRRLTYSTTMTGPRPVGTFTRAVHLEGELYPFAFGNQKSPAAGLGFAGEYEKTLGLAITVPGTTTVVPIDQAHYFIGARYRIFANPTTQIALGLDYARRHYIADRSKLGTPGEFDAPDVDYTAVVPNVGFRKAFSPKAAFFARAGGLLILDTGQIQEKDQYGAATVYGVEGRVGLDVTLSPRVALRLAGHFGQITFKFKGNGDLAMARGVSGAADRDFGLATMLGVTY